MLRQTNRIPVIMHGLRNYDAHFIIRHLASMGFAKDVRILPKNSESYLSFSLKVAVPKHENDLSIDDDNETTTVTLQFIDSFSFMSRSLSELASLLPRENCHILRSEIDRSKLYRDRADDEDWLQLLARSESSTETMVDLLRRKGCYPYDATSSLAFFNETKLPDRERFYSFLTDTHITSDDYVHAQRIWQEFKVSDMGMYSDLYLMTDVLLLACVFEEFRQISFSSTGIDPAHHLSTPGFTWDACLKETKVELECITDPDMYLMMERGIRGGLSQISLRYAKANNPKAAITELDYDASKPTSWLMYYDVNNLYATTMVTPLPYAGFEWVQFNEKFTHEDLLKAVIEQKPDSPRGGFIEVDIEYPEDAHGLRKLHDQFPMCPELIICPEPSPSQRRLQHAGRKRKHNENSNVSSGDTDARRSSSSGGRKLVAHLMKRERYVIHTRALALYMRLGMRVTKVYRAIRFLQKPWMQPYVEKNTKLRQAAKDSFARDFFKLMNNALYGKRNHGCITDNVRHLVPNLHLFIIGFLLRL
jgi:hypothetical protein